MTDVDYQAVLTDMQIMVRGLTQSRTVNLPSPAQFKFGKDLVILDADGSCSDAHTIVIQAGAGDTINGQTQIILFDSYQFICLGRGASNLWIRLQ